MIKPHLRAASKITSLKRTGLALGFICLGGAVFAQTAPQTSTNTFTVNKAIPDGNPSGISDTRTLDFTGQQLYSITDVSVTLTISGGFNGDYYGYLVHDGGYAVLLNRVGRTSANSTGYSDSGMTITLSGSSANDIHNYHNVSNPGGGMLTGTFAEDGRNVDPSLTLDTDPRTALLSSMNGQNPSGQWTLFLADMDYGQQGQLVNWGLVVTAVPEPGTLGLMALGLGGMLGLGAWLRRRK